MHEQGTAETEASNFSQDAERSEGSALDTDLYHVDAAYIAWKHNHNGEATFDLYTRRAPFVGTFMLVAGLQPALDYIQSFRYTDDDLEWLQRIKGYETAFIEYLRNIRFTGSILAM